METIALLGGGIRVSVSDSVHLEVVYFELLLKYADLFYRCSVMNFVLTHSQFGKIWIR
jgi:hypothetical protein